MKLTHLRLESFRSYVAVDVPLGASRVLIAGENGAGKSSIREAVRWLLTGRCAVTDGRGAGAELLAPHGTDRVCVSAEGTPFGTARRERQRSSHEFVVADMKGESSLQQQALYVKLNTTPAFLDAVLETEHFLRLHHAEAKALVLSLLDVKVEANGETLTLDQMDARYDQVFKARKDAKIRLRDHVVPALPEPAMPPLDAVEAQLARLRQDLSGLHQQMGEAEGQRKALRTQLAALSPIQVLGQTLDEWRAEIAGIEEAIARAEQAQAPAPVVGDGQQVLVLTRKQEALKAHDPKRGCVLDDSIECPQSKRKFTVRAREVGIELSALPPTSAPEPKTTGQSTARLRDSLHAAQQGYALRERQEQEASEREAARAGLERQLAAIGEPDASLVAQIATLEARIGKGEIVRKQAQSYAEAVQRRTAEQERHQALQADVDRLEREVEFYGPNGQRVQALQQAIGRFTTAINASLERFGWTVTFILDPWGVEVNGRPLETYSESEQFRIGIGVQVAIAELSGLSFAIVDRLDMLDLANRSLATQMIMQSSLEQVLILATREAAAPLPQVSKALAHRVVRNGDRSLLAETVGV